MPGADRLEAASEPSSPELSTLASLRRGLELSPHLRRGVAGTLGLAAVATIGKVAVPIAIQQGVDGGLLAPGGPDVGRIATTVAVAIVALVVTTYCAYLMNVRLYRMSEATLSSVRIQTFRHIHDLSTLHQQAQRRGSLVSRVTSDVDQLSQFLQRGGVILVTSTGQLVISTVVMLVYSWQLTLVVYVTLAPLAVVVRLLQRRLRRGYAAVRASVATLLAAISEAVVGAGVIRAYGVQDRTARRLVKAIDHNRSAQLDALRTSVTSNAAAETVAGLASMTVIVVGVLIGVGGQLSIGTLTAFLFLVTLFVQPVQMATEVVNETQNAIASWRRILDILDATPDVADPAAAGSSAADPAAAARDAAGPNTAGRTAAGRDAAVFAAPAARSAGTDLPAGPLSVRFSHVHFAYPGGPEVLTDIDLTITAQRRVAVVGETGSGKTTLAKLLTRLMDPASGTITLSGTPLTTVRFASLRRRVGMVPQDGFLFDTTIAENVRFGALAAAGPRPTDDDLAAVFADLGLADWVAGLPHGLATPVGERGEALSAGERQLVALARAYLVDPDLLVLDEATSAIDPATEVRLQRALDTVTRGRTTVAIAHRLSTAQSADEVIVVDRGRVVQRGTHAELVADPASVYGRLYASWLTQVH